MPARIVNSIPSGQTSTSLDLQSGDCFLLFFLCDAQYWGGLPDPETCLILDEPNATKTAISDSRHTKWLSQDKMATCYIHVGRITRGMHSASIVVPTGGSLYRGYVIRGTNGNFQSVDIRWNPQSWLPIAEYDEKWPNHPQHNFFATAFPYTVSVRGKNAIQLTRTSVNIFIWGAGIGAGPPSWTSLNNAPYGELIYKDAPGVLGDDGYALNLREISDGAIMEAPSYTYGTEDSSSVLSSEVEVWCGYYLFYDTTEDAGFPGDPPGEQTDDASATGGITQISAYVEATDVGNNDNDGPNATRTTQIGSYIEAIPADNDGNPEHATDITQAGAYVESTSANGAESTGVTQAGAYIESTTTDSADATSITHVGIYIEAIYTPADQTIRISQAFALVEARRYPRPIRISQAFALVEARRESSKPLPPPGAGDILHRPPEYQQAPPVPFNPADLLAKPGQALPDLPQYQQAPPAPLRPLQWVSAPIMQPIDMPPLPEAAPYESSAFPSAGRGDILSITQARVARSTLVDTLASTLDAQSAPVRGAAIGNNVAMINGVPAQTTEAAPVPGRIATYTNIGRTCKAIYAPEAQTPAAQKINSATDTAADTRLPAASPTTRINVVYPLLGGGALTSDITIALDQDGYREQIAAVLDALLQTTATIGYEAGEEPNTFHLYVIPGTVDAATLDGLTAQDLQLIGTADNQILRYNARDGIWQPASEPLALKGATLTANNQPTFEGEIRYNPLTGHLEMLVETA